MNTYLKKLLYVSVLIISTNALGASSPTPTPSGITGDRFFEEYFDPSFFKRSYDPFEEMRHIRDRMLKGFNGVDKNMDAFDVWFEKKYGGLVTDIHQREDRHFVYYDITVPNLTDEKVDVKVQNGNIILSGYLEKKSDQTSEEMTFQRTFPVPINIDTKHVEFDQGVGKITVKFMKIFPGKTHEISSGNGSTKKA